MGSANGTRRRAKPADPPEPVQLPPQSREAEKGVIGSVLRDNSLIPAVLGKLRTSDFYHDHHQKIFQAVIALHAAGTPVDTVTLFEELRRRGQVEDVGGAEYLAELWDAAPTAANWSYYAGIVADKAAVRNLIHAGTELVRDAYDGVTSADDLLGRAERAVREIAEARGPAAGNELPLLYVGDVEPVLDTADFVQGLLTDGTMSVVYGDSGSGKTFFALDLALHVAAGWPWRDRGVERKGVLYLALEGGHGVRNRVAAFKERRGVDRLPLAIVPVQVNLLDPAADVARVIGAAGRAAKSMALPVGLVVVDTLSRALFGGNENSPEDMGALVANLDRIRQALPAHVQVVHHSGKDTAKGARGHSLLRAATDTEIEVTRDPDGGVSVARVTKQRDLPCEGEFPFALESIPLGYDRRGRPVTSCVVVEAEAVPRPQACLTGDPKAALNILTDLIADKGKTGEAGVPHGTRCVTFEDWRSEFYAKAKPGDKPDTKKKAFGRAKDRLTEERIVYLVEPFVWLADGPGQTGQTGQCPDLSRDKRDTTL